MWNGIAKNRTTIAIAHRLSTVVGANQIVVLDAGGAELEEVVEDN